MPHTLKLMLFLFFGVMAIVVVIAYSRPGHSTRFDTLELQKIRADSTPPSS